MNDPNDREWDAFVDAHPAGSFFHLSAWRGVAQKVFGHRTFQLRVHRHGALVAVLPLVEVRSRLFGHALIGNGFCVGGGPLALDEAALADILSQAEMLGRELGVEYVELRDTPEAGPDWRPRSDLYVNFARQAAADEAENFNQIPRKQRKVVRLALARGFTVTVDPSADDFYPLYARTMRNHGTPAMPRKYFDELASVFGADCEFMTVRDGGRPLSSVISYFYKDRVMPYYIGSGPAARTGGSNDMLLWSVMRRAVERGYPVFDFGRSKVGTGPYNFKCNWGFEPRPMTTQYRLLKTETLPNINPTNPHYAAFIKIWRRLPMPIANSISPLLSRSLG
jgi:FemAB-related protein (PEP-CTERM system-associated)